MIEIANGVCTPVTPAKKRIPYTGLKYEGYKPTVGLVAHVLTDEHPRIGRTGMLGVRTSTVVKVDGTTFETLNSVYYKV